jgi:hypothetical protein
MPQGTIDQQLWYLTHIQGNMKRLGIMQYIFNSKKQKKLPKALQDLHTNLDLVNRCGG